MHLDWPAGENILDNILFGSFISVDLKQTEHTDYEILAEQKKNITQKLHGCILIK